MTDKTNHSFPPFLTRQGLEDAASEYRQIYPFQDFDPSVQQSYLKTMERSETLKDILTELKTPCFFFDSLVFLFNMLKEKYLKSKNMAFFYFMDCLGSGGAACNLAVLNGYEKCLSIELSERTKERSRTAYEKMIDRYGPSLKQQIDYRVGSMGDYFDCEASIVFMSTLEVQERSPLVDEAQLVRLYCRLTKSLEVGSYGILITKRISLQLFQARHDSEENVVTTATKFSHFQILYEKEQDGHRMCLLQIVMERV
eukprot:gene3264-3575_t